MILYPKAMFDHVTEITFEFLKEKEIKALILDVDNTLIDFELNLTKETVSWAEQLKQKGIKLYILSNTNKKEKVKMVAGKLGIPFEYFAKKPFKKGFLKIQKKLEEKPEHIGVIGDQIFTDILGANRCHMFPILVEPIANKDIWITIIKRPIEKWIKNQYQKKQAKEKK